MLGFDTTRKSCAHSLLSHHVFLPYIPCIQQALKQELAYASYLDVHSAILPPPRNRPHVDAYARAVNACLKSVPFINLSIRLPPYDPSIFQNQAPVTNSRFSMSLAMGAAFAPGLPSPSPSLRSPDGDLNATWEIWDIIRSICDYNPRLTLSLFLRPSRAVRLAQSSSSSS